MEYMGTDNQVKFCDGIFDLLISTGLVVEGIHYNKEGKGKLITWDNKIHDTVSDSCLAILKSIS